MSTEPRKKIKSTITCDMEGRIETFNAGAETIFGYEADEVVGKKRVSLFSPGLVVLGHVGNWLKAAREEGEFQGQTVFVRKDGTRFAARIRITPTWADGRGSEQIGYCGVTEPLEDVDPASAMPAISPWTRIFSWLVITRAPFLTAALVPVLIGAAWAAFGGASVAWWAVAAAAVGACALQVAANTFNDYFDWKSGTDPENTEYFQAFSGGSRAIELRLVTERGTFLVGVAAALVAAAVATYGVPGLVGLKLAGVAVCLLVSCYGALVWDDLFAYYAPPVGLALVGAVLTANNLWLLG